MKDKNQEREIIKLWLQRPESKRLNHTHVLAFDGWLRMNCPDLLIGVKMDTHQQLKTILRNYIPDKN
jgi:hypothetical protein